MLVFAEAPELLPPSSSRQDLEKSIEAARLSGWRIHFIPPEFSGECSAEDALSHLQPAAGPEPAVWIGYIPPLSRYRELYKAAAALNYFLLNAPEEHRRVQEFDAAYPFLEGITPASEIITSVDECEAAAGHLGLPLFVKGTVQSRKARGWKACVAESVDEFRRLTAALLELENRSRGKVIARQLVRLRHSREINGFPLGREYRVMLYRGEVLALGYYWEGADELRELSQKERRVVEALATEAGRRLDVPYVAVDIGQAQNGEWIVIESGDPQFCGFSQISALGLWNRIASIEKTFLSRTALS